MGYKVTPKQADTTLTVKTGLNKKQAKPMAWWKAKSKQELCEQLLGTAAFLKEQQQYRYRQMATYARLYSNFPMYGWVGTSLNKMNMNSQLPTDRPTLNVVQSCIDTLVSRITQSNPRPMFLTDDGNYKERKLAKQLNNFIQGEFYQNNIKALGPQALKDSCIMGDGLTKVFRHEDRVKCERRLSTELLVDPNEAMYGFPRSMFELQLMDRDVADELFKGNGSKVENAEEAYPTAYGDSEKSISDQIMIVEAWHLPSGKDAKDGMHVIACSSGILFEEKWEKDYFPFVKLPYSERPLGYWSQGLAEQITGTQTEINKLLMTISKSQHLVGVPRVFVEEGSKVVKAHLNDQIGAIVTYRGTKPIYEVAPCVSPELYQQLQRLVEYAYQQTGVSTLAAAGQKPQGLNSGEAQRVYDDIQTDRFATLQKKYAEYHEKLAYLMFDTACDIAKDTGSYSTIYPNKNGAKEIDLPEISKEKKNAYIIQCYDVSALPKDPAGRLQKITEMVQAGMIDIREGRRLLDYPDLDQVEKLANASEERILQALDKIVDDGEFTPPDPYMDLELGVKLSVQYYNLYVASKLEEEKAQMLRDFNQQCKELGMQAMPPAPAPMPGMGGAAPQAAPEPLPTNPLIPNAPGAA